MSFHNFDGFLSMWDNNRLAGFQILTKHLFNLFKVFSQIYEQSARNVNASDSTGEVKTERL